MLGIGDPRRGFEQRGSQLPALILGFGDLGFGEFRVHVGFWGLGFRDLGLFPVYLPLYLSRPTPQAWTQKESR